MIALYVSLLPLVAASLTTSLEPGDSTINVETAYAVNLDFSGNPLEAGSKIVIDFP